MSKNWVNLVLYISKSTVVGGTLISFLVITQGRFMVELYICRIDSKLELSKCTF